LGGWLSWQRGHEIAYILYKSFLSIAMIVTMGVL